MPDSAQRQPYSQTDEGLKVEHRLRTNHQRHHALDLALDLHHDQSRGPEFFLQNELSSIYCHLLRCLGLPHRLFL